MKKLPIIAFIVLWCATSSAQQTVFEESETVYSNETGGGLTLHTQGWGINFYMSKYLSGFTKRQFHFEFVSMSNDRQYRIPLANGGYYYGKLNSISLLRTSVGFQKDFIPRQSLKGISISYILNAGLSSCFAKPIYLQIEKESGVVVDERYDPEKHNLNNIKGSSRPFVGLDDMGYYPGLFLRGALNFDYAKRRNSVRAIEVGIAADIYAQAVPMMAYEDPHQYFLTAFVNLVFGGRKFHGQNKDNVEHIEGPQ